MNRPAISVAMATYNGAAYLREQLESIAAQTSLPDELVVGDDKSTDETVGIIEEFAKSAPFPVRVTVNETPLRYGRNFLETALRCRSEWVAFCDQDDIWLDRKLELVRNKIMLSPVSDLMMVTHAIKYVDEGLNELQFRKPALEGDHIYRRRHFRRVNIVHGMAQVVRKQIFEQFDWQICPPFATSGGPQFSHDGWTCVIANAIGSRINIGEACVLYRRHASAETTGNEKAPSIGKRVSAAIQRDAETFSELARFSAVMAEYLKLLAMSQTGETAFHLDAAADDLFKSSRIDEKRAALRCEAGFLSRWVGYAGLWVAGDYLTPGFRKGALGDALFVLKGR